MNKSYSRWFLAALALLLLVSFATPPVLAAAARGGGGARAGAGQNVQPNNSRADVRTNDVRSTSVNNVNANRNVNVNVDQNRDGWDHPVAAAMIVGGAIAAVGSRVHTVPQNCVPVNYGGVIYQQCGGTWYVAQGSEFVVVNPPY